MDDDDDFGEIDGLRALEATAAAPPAPTAAFAEGDGDADLTP